MRQEFLKVAHGLDRAYYLDPAQRRFQLESDALQTLLDFDVQCLI